MQIQLMFRYYSSFQTLKFLKFLKLVILLTVKSNFILIFSKLIKFYINIFQTNHMFVYRASLDDLKIPMKVINCTNFKLFAHLLKTVNFITENFFINNI